MYTCCLCLLVVGCCVVLRCSSGEEWSRGPARGGCVASGARREQNMTHVSRTPAASGARREQNMTRARPLPCAAHSNALLATTIATAHTLSAVASAAYASRSTAKTGSTEQTSALLPLSRKPPHRGSCVNVATQQHVAQPHSTTPPCSLCHRPSAAQRSRGPAVAASGPAPSPRPCRPVELCPSVSLPLAKTTARRRQSTWRSGQRRRAGPGLRPPAAAQAPRRRCLLLALLRALHSHTRRAQPHTPQLQATARR
jgi:hypothetical protein